MKDPKDPQCVFKEGAGDNGRVVMLRGIGVTRDAPRFEKWLAGLLGEFSAWRGWIGVFGSVCCCCLRRLEAGGFCCLPSCAGGSQVARREGDGPWRHGHGESRHRASARLPNWDRITGPDPQVRNGQPAGECSWRSWRLHLFFLDRICALCINRKNPMSHQAPTSGMTIEAEDDSKHDGKRWRGRRSQGGVGPGGILGMTRGKPCFADHGDQDFFNRSNDCEWRRRVGPTSIISNECCTPELGNGGPHEAASFLMV